MRTKTLNAAHQIRHRLAAGMLLIALLPPFALAQTPTSAHKAQPAPAATAPAPNAAPAAPLDEETLGQVRRELIDLLRATPRLTEVLRYDPALLSDNDYIGRRNPRLAQFLAQHPEIARNPEFYLFSRTGGANLQEVAWNSESERERVYNRMMNDIGPFVIFVMIFGGLLWLLQLIVAQLRWKRTFNTQTEIYNKLLDKFSSNEELLAYVRSEAGRRFLESATLPLNTEGLNRGAISPTRMLLPLQAGAVLAVLGIGLFFLRGRFGESGEIFLVFSILALALGFGFIISAALGFLVARRLGLLPAALLEANGNGERNHKSIGTTVL
jgi:hypothetical protein